MADYERDPESGMPLLAAQRCLTMTRVTDDLSDRILNETMVFPNLIIFWLVDPETGTHVGESRVCSTRWARMFIDELPAVAEHVTECGCQFHAGSSMEFLDPDVVLA